jgi:hypothetical protein
MALQDTNQKLFFLRVFCLLLFEGTFTSFFKDKKQCCVSALDTDPDPAFLVNADPADPHLDPVFQ